MDVCMFCSTQVSGAFCCKCGTKIPTSEKEYVLTYYFRKGYSHQTMLYFLERHHGLKICRRTLINYLNSYGLQRRKKLTDNMSRKVDTVLQYELQGPTQISGYRTMWNRLRMFHGLAVPRDTVMHKLRDIDPQGCRDRSTRKLIRRRYSVHGPNEIWHLDGYDKLKPYGFPIHGCVDGYSRRILWLRVIHSNNDPIVTGRLFLNTISKVSGCPLRVRSDCGSENVVLSAMQCYLRRNHTDAYAAERSHIYGSSHANQRIEGWWSFFRRNRSSFFIDFFKNMIDSGIYNPDDKLQLACCRFCFAKLLQKDLDEVAECWNAHYIRRSRHDTVPGRPDELYYIPERTERENMLRAVDDNDVREMQQYLTSKESEMTDDDEDYYEYFNYVVSSLSLNASEDWDSTLQFYNTLMSHAR